jgi:hypothetical protein
MLDEVENNDGAAISSKEIVEVPRSGCEERVDDANCVEVGLYRQDVTRWTDPYFLLVASASCCLILVSNIQEYSRDTVPSCCEILMLSTSRQHAHLYIAGVSGIGSSTSTALPSSRPVKGSRQGFAYYLFRLYFISNISLRLR